MSARVILIPASAVRLLVPRGHPTFCVVSANFRIDPRVAA
jgi:hypothetical protein